MADWTPPDRILAEAPGRGVDMWGRAVGFYKIPLEDPPTVDGYETYLLATPERVAAGELVEALEHVIKWMDEYHIPVCELRDELPYNVDLLRAALAKAGKETDDDQG